MEDKTIFFSYSRDNSDFVINLAKELRTAGAKVWLDQLDIKPGTRWDKSIEEALKQSGTLLVVLSKSSVASDNVMDEVSYALEEGKTVVPVLLEECEIPFRLRRLQFADFTSSHEQGIATLNKALRLEEDIAGKLEKEAAEFDMAKAESKPRVDPAQAAASPSGKSKKGLFIALAAIAAVILVVVIINPFAGEEHIDSINADQGLGETDQKSGVQTDAVEADEKAWKRATNENSVYSYLSYLYNTTTADAHFQEAINAIDGLLTNEAIAVFSDSDVVYFDNVMFIEGNQVKRDETENVIQTPVKGNVLQAFFDVDIFDVDTQQWLNTSLPKGTFVIVDSVTATTEDGMINVYIRY